MALSEFEIIDKFFNCVKNNRIDTVVGRGDDCAVLKPNSRFHLAVSVDTLVENVHFEKGTDPQLLGHKSLAVNLSDLAAIGAEPAWCTLALTLPEVDPAWLSAFQSGFIGLANQHHVQLIGGDITRGHHLIITVQIQGYLPRNHALLRSNAKPGDLIYLTGSIGDAGLALLAQQRRLTMTEAELEQINFRLLKPEPRVKQGLDIIGVAHAAIDISDGLIADLEHILEASHAGASIYLDDIPISSIVKKHMIQQEDWLIPLSSGDDYELCFTVPENNQHLIEKIAQQWNCHCTCIGAIEAEPGLRCVDKQGELVYFTKSGYEHF